MTGWASLLVRAPIARGILRGHWWLPAGGGKVWRVLGGTYELRETDLFARLVAPGATVLDLGAHIGYYTLLASRLVGPTGRVFAFEPDPMNVWYLRQHARLNRCANVEVMETAVCDRSGTVSFARGTGSGTGHVAPDGPMSVAAVRLDDFVRDRQVEPGAIKIDVEGAEAAVLGGAGETLRSFRPTIFLSTHSPESRARCEAVLSRLEYRATAMDGLSNGAARELLCLPAERWTPGALGGAGA